MKLKPIEKMKKHIRLLAIAIAEQQKKGQINPFLMKDLNHIIFEEDLEGAKD